MSVDPRRLRELASQTGFRAETLERVIRLGEIAGDVARHPLLSRALVLKGGTAINLCFGKPRRLSVDLDFNYIGSLEKGTMEGERPDIERALSTTKRSEVRLRHAASTNAAALCEAALEDSRDRRFRDAAHSGRAALDLLPGAGPYDGAGAQAL